MVKRTGATQESSGRSAKWSKHINFLSSDSESELPDLDFPRSARSTQQARNVTRSQRNAVDSRDSAYYSELVEADAEAQDDEEPTKNRRISALRTAMRRATAATHQASMVTLLLSDLFK